MVDVKKLRYKVEKTPEDHDADQVFFFVGGKSVPGYGYKSKKDGKKIGLIKCPRCTSENYALSVATGVCSFCGLDVNKIAEQEAL